MKALPLWCLAAVAGLLAFLVAVAAGRGRQETLADLQEYAFVQDPHRRQELEAIASDALGRELARPVIDRRIAAAAFAVVRLTAQGETLRAQLAGYAHNALDVELARKHPDETVLRAGYELLTVVDQPGAQLYHARITAIAGERQDLVEAVTRSARLLRDRLGQDGGDAALVRLVEDVGRLTGPRPPAGSLNWAAREEPTIAAALEEAAQAALSHFEALVEPYRLEAEVAGDPATVHSNARLELRARAINEANAALPERLGLIWLQLKALGLDGRCEPDYLAGFAAAVRQRHLPVVGSLIGAGSFLLMFGALILALRRVAKGPRQIDPSAETLENVEPIDLDTDADTLEARRQQTTGGGDTTMH